MQNRHTHLLWLVCLVALVSSCASRKVVSTNYYMEHEKTLTAIEDTYRTISQQHRQFSIAFTDKSFQYISIEILTDSIKFIYEFNIKEQRLADTLQKYRLPVQPTIALINQMSSIHCIWINNLDYYVNGQKRALVFMSIRPVAFHWPFSSEKYYILTFYSQPQYFDAEGRLLASRQVRKLRKINDDIFRRINDKVAYTISERFR